MNLPTLIGLAVAARSAVNKAADELEHDLLSIGADTIWTRMPRPAIDFDYGARLSWHIPIPGFRDGSWHAAQCSRHRLDRKGFWSLILIDREGNHLPNSHRGLAEILAAIREHIEKHTTKEELDAALRAEEIETLAAFEEADL